MGRVICRFSCGATSAVATKMALAKYRGTDTEVVITRSTTGSEHFDNERFTADCVRWFNEPIEFQHSTRFKDTFNVWETERFIVSHRGSSCTDELKRIPSEAMIRRGDIIVLGFEAGEERRADRYRAANDHVTIETPLIEAGLTKSDCLAIIERAGIEKPMMYKMGYVHNNCPACPKAGMWHWNKVRVDFPDQFERMAALQRELGPDSGFHKYRGKRIRLDELPPRAGRKSAETTVSCSMMCHIAEKDMAA